jgi:hypothetical protein
MSSTHDPIERTAAIKVRCLLYLLEIEHRDIFLVPLVQLHRTCPPSRFKKTISTFMSGPPDSV